MGRERMSNILNVGRLLMSLFYLLDLFGISDSQEIINLRIAPDIDVIEKELTYSAEKPILLRCDLNVNNKGQIKWFQINGAFHKFLRVQSYKAGKNNTEIFNKKMTVEDHNTKIYCLFQPFMQNTCEIISESIKLKYYTNPAVEAPKPSSEQIKPKVYIYNENITCCVRKNKNILEKKPILEMYELKGRIARLLHTHQIESFNITLPNITVCENNTKVYCRAIVNDTSDSFYRSDDSEFSKVTPRHLETCREMQTCEIEYRGDSQNNDDNNILVTTERETASTEIQSDLSNKEVMISVCSSVACIVILMAIVILHFCVKKRRSRSKNEPKVLYAELEVSQQKSFNMPTRQDTPYAEIVGVLKPAKNNKKMMKPNGTRTEESPYAVPYTSHYAQVIMNNSNT